MLENFDLDEIAEAYLSARTPDRPEYERLLIRAREKAVFPLLHALLAQAIKQKKVSGDIGRGLGMTDSGTGLAEYLYAKSTFEPEVEKAYDVIQRTGQPAKTELCRALLERDYRVRLAAALLLSMDETPSSETQNGIQNSLGYLADPSQSLILMLLGIVMFRAGDTKWRQAIESHARDSGTSLQEWIERTRDTALIELQRGN